MRVWVERGGEGSVVDVRAHPTATVGDLVDALGIVPGIRVSVDDRSVEASTPLVDTGLADGSVLRLGGRERRRRDGLRLHLRRGPDAGRSVALVGDEMVVGRDGDLTVDNPSVSAHHARIEAHADGVRVTDLGSRNGTRRGDALLIDTTHVEPGTAIRLGSTVATVDGPRADDRAALTPRPDAKAHWSVNRPPRPPVPAGPEPIEPPVPSSAPAAPRLALAALVAPLLVAGVLVAALGSWRFALFALLSPVMVGATHLSNRRRHGRERRAADAATRHSDERFRFAVREAAERERERRRAFAPDPAEIARRIELPSARLWERRPGDADAFTVGLGTGEACWSPPIDESGPQRVDVEELLAATADATLGSVELVADLGAGPLGIVGERRLARRLARSIIVQLAVHHGPADLRAIVFTTAGRAPDWEWINWLPHADASIVLDGGWGSAAATILAGAADGRPGHLVIVDGPVADDRSGELRRVLADADRRVLGVVLAADDAHLPASVSGIVAVTDESGTIVCTRPADPSFVERGVADGLTRATAESLARRMARFVDPEAPAPDGHDDGPAVVIDALEDTVDEIGSRWDRPRIGSLAAPIGRVSGASFAIDLVADGPHALVGGTTGSGKSELLRTLVASIAARHSPERVGFVLIDYKGGAAFDRCVDLPHVVGVVTDLDGHLAERALVSLEAELRSRERALRESGASSIDDHVRAGGTLSRLVIVIDEFSALRAELPDFVDAVVDLSSRGRSLGLHLVLATQRPSGVVDATIRANSNLRIALRMQDRSDSLDVIDDPSAAALPADTPGRALVRIGSSDPLEVQVAHLADPMAHSAPVTVCPLDRRTLRRVDAGAPGPAALDVLVERVADAARDRRAPLRPWLDDLPAEVGHGDIDGLPSLDDSDLVVAVADDPARQRRVSVGWDRRRGGLIVYGAHGAGVTTCLRRVIVELGRVSPAPWTYVIDGSAGDLADVEALPHVGARLGRGDDDRLRRLLAMLELELEARATAASDRTPIALVIDGMASFLDRVETVTGGVRVLERIVHDGQDLGIALAVGARRPADVPRWLSASAHRRLVLELPDATDRHLAAPERRTWPSFRPGRCLVDDGELVAQVVLPRAAAVPVESAAAPPPPVESLPDVVSVGDVGPARGGDRLYVPVAMADRTRTPLGLELAPGEHALIAGPSGSGRTATLLTIARQLRTADRSLVLVGVGLDGGGFDATGTLDGLDHVLASAVDDTRRWVVLVDDADRTPGDHPRMLAAVAAPNVSVIAAVRPSVLRQDPTHWVRHLRAGGSGVLLQPDAAVDGELLMVRLPRADVGPRRPGRGYVVSRGAADAAQIAR